VKVAPQNLVIISLGSNLGDSANLLRAAMDRMAGFADGPLLRSSIWETDPVDCPPGSPIFLNAAVGFVPKASGTPERLLSELKKIEARTGRQAKKTMNEPRPLDLDIIVYQTELRATPTLTLPHPRAHLRAFVLGPVSEIAPMLVFPGHQFTVAEMFRRLPATERRGARRTEVSAER
jgi:2-amino-4-hydroxy-6-hydroxymethyldihydropteridine diphosphokinase